MEIYRSYGLSPLHFFNRFFPFITGNCKEAEVSEIQAITSLFTIARLQKESLKPKPVLQSDRKFSEWNGKSKLYLKKLALRIESKDGLLLVCDDWGQGTREDLLSCPQPQGWGIAGNSTCILYIPTSLGSQLRESSRLDKGSTFNCTWSSPCWLNVVVFLILNFDTLGIIWVTFDFAFQTN